MSSDACYLQSLGSLESLFDEFWSLPRTDNSDSFFTELEKKIQAPINLPEEPESAPNFKKYAHPDTFSIRLIFFLRDETLDKMKARFRNFLALIEIMKRITHHLIQQRISRTRHIYFHHLLFFCFINISSNIQPS